MDTAGRPLSDWLIRLESLSPTEIDLGLDRVDVVLERLALELPPTVIHVAGTNGKGSSVAMLEALLRGTGRSVGCYTSPHIQAYNERIRIDGVDATDEKIVTAFQRIEAVRGDVPLTYFEYGTLAALAVFADARTELAILEVGMGGRLDAVNAVEPTAGLITNIALDHCDWLGNDVETIAREKAGIMRGGKPIVFGSKDMPAAIASSAATTGATLIAAGRDFDWSHEGDDWSWRSDRHELSGLARPALPGAHQIPNAAGVLALCEAAGFADVLQADRINKALGGVRLDGRMQRFAWDPRWLIDVAHNPAAAEALAATLKDNPVAGRTIAVVGMLDDKDIDGIVSPLLGIVDEWIAVTADSPRAIPAGELGRRVANLANAACLVADSIGHGVNHARVIAAERDRILVTGSFYLAGPVLQLYSPRTS
jgi:dihydrofolate synthase/folylpolyglutamate synthase